MSGNLELKAKAPSLQRMRRVATQLGAVCMGTLIQKDTFLHTASGRLKLREQAGSPSELIFYHRPDRGTVRGRWSRYLRVPVNSPGTFLRHFPGPSKDRIVVRKKRTLFLFRNCRIHLDRVYGLGPFIEFEILSDKRSGRSERFLSELIHGFGIRPENIVPDAYADLLAARLRS